MRSMKIGLETGRIGEIASHFVPQAPDPQVDYTAFEGIPEAFSEEQIMTPDTWYHIPDARTLIKNVVQNTKEFVEDHPVITGMGVAAALVASEKIIEHFTNSKHPHTIQTSV